MASIKLKFRPSMVDGKEGVLYFQIIHNREVRRINSGARILASEWDDDVGSIKTPDAQNPRHERLRSIINDAKWQIERFNNMQVDDLTIDEIASRFYGMTSDGQGLFDYLRSRSERLGNLGRKRCSEMVMAALRSFMKFRGGIDISLERINVALIEEYEVWLKGRGLKRNSTSFYMRTLRTAYRKAVAEGLVIDLNPFRTVYTGIDKTNKRAISKTDMKRIRQLNLSMRPALELARDMLLFSFYMRGMPFVDMAYLKKTDVVDGIATYKRRKTSQSLRVELLPQAKEIVSKYVNDTIYLLPIITQEDGTERRQYQNKMLQVNRNLKKIGTMVGLNIPLTIYVARHGWATLARDNDVPLSYISEALGHDNEKTTQIYLDSIQTSKIDEINRRMFEDF